ncbi:MAG: hypothetical protein KGH89_09215 [Thaumarchaeota archaeon]|nr:hypothetical protein [Nitrososphaerota archaeon]MDE1826924.1 hypothetical protein [Nitrososphaerota archaeon]MDE1871926.1 hypothetical protein [Nitrososphaerota archaeon]
MDSEQKKKINMFAVLVVLMIAVPELVAHFYFDTQKHLPTSSVDAALSLTNKQHDMYVNGDMRCHLVLKNDTTAVNVSRASGIQGQYAVYSCT